MLGLATSYVRVTPHQNVGSDETLKIRVRGAAPVRGWLVHRKSNGAADITDLDLQGGPAELEIAGFSFAGTTEVVLVFSNGTGFPGSFSYELELPIVLDLAFCMDTTGSMAGSIEAVKATASRTRELLESADADFRIAITEFKDHPVWPYGWTGDFPYRMNSVFSNEASVIDGGLAMLQAWGGGDWPESTYSGVMGAINAIGITPWRKGVKKAIIVMTDAPPHDPEPYTSHTRAAVVAAANAGGAVHRADGVAGPAVHAVAAETPIAIYGVVVGSDFGAYSAMSALAGATGGKVWVTSYDSGNIADAILEAIGEISGAEPPPPPSGNRPPDVRAAIADPGQLWPPNNKLVPIRLTNVSDPDGDAVTIAVTRITQDEPLGRDADADGIGAATARVRAARNGGGNGRVYAIAFTATDARGASSSGSVTVCVPHDRGGNTVCTDDGQSYTSTAP